MSRFEFVSSLYFPPITQILDTFFHLIITGILPLELGKSLWRMGAGFFMAAFLMIPLGVAMGMNSQAYRLFHPLVELLRPLPPPAIIPAVMIFLGIGHSMKIFVIFFACSFPIVLNTIAGVCQVPKLFLNTGQSFSLDKHVIVCKIVLPSALPYILYGLRTSIPIALIVAVLSEMIGSVDGIGHFILHMQRVFSIKEMYAGIFGLGLTGFLLNILLFKLDSWLLFWYHGWKNRGSV